MIHDISKKVKYFSVCNIFWHCKSLSQLTVREVISWLPIFSPTWIHLSDISQTVSKFEAERELL